LAREDGDAEGTAANNSDDGDLQPGEKHLTASMAVRAKDRPEAVTTMNLHQNKKGKTAITSGKRRPRKAK
jgi:hypothetical protein